MSTNKPIFGPVVLEIACDMLKKQDIRHFLSIVTSSLHDEIIAYYFILTIICTGHDAEGYIFISKTYHLKRVIYGYDSDAIFGISLVSCY